MDPNTAAVHRLPHDILHDLFVLCNADAIDSGLGHFAVVLSHVCSAWRASALTTPEVWRRVYIVTPSSLQEVMRVRAYLERSGAITVEAHIRVKITPSVHAPEFTLLAQHAHRIRRLSLLYSDVELTRMHELLGCVPVEMPVLESFLLSTVEPKGPEIALCLAPRRSRNDTPPFRLPRLGDSDVQWSSWASTNITDLRMNGLDRMARPSMESMRHILTGCRSTLETFEFCGLAPVYDDPNSILAPVVLPLLQNLVFFFLDDLAPLAGLICAPDLRSISISNGNRCVNPYPIEEGTEIVDCDMPRMLEHLSASGAMLQQLFLYCVPPCPRNTVDRFYAALPALDTIMLFETDAVFRDALFLPECTFRTPREPILPLLSELAITDTVATDLGRFLLRHKTQPVAPLKSLTMTYGLYDAAYEAPSILGYILDMCIAGGLRVSCRQTPIRVPVNEERETEA